MAIVFSKVKTTATNVLMEGDVCSSQPLPKK